MSQESAPIIVNVKTRAGEDLLGILEETETHSRLLHPLVIEAHPNIGITGRSWLLFSEMDFVDLEDLDAVYIHPANSSAISYYTLFMNQMSGKSSETDEPESARALGTYLH